MTEDGFQARLEKYASASPSRASSAARPAWSNHAPLDRFAARPGQPAADPQPTQRRKGNLERREKDGSRGD